MFFLKHLDWSLAQLTLFQSIELPKESSPRP